MILLTLSRQCMDLTGVVFGKDILDWAHFYLSNLTQAEFASTDLRRAKFRGSDLKGVDFGNSDLTGARFDNFRDGHRQYETRLETYTKRLDADNSLTLRTAFGSGSLSGAQFVGAYLEGLEFIDEDLTGTNFIGASLNGVYFPRGESHRRRFLQRHAGRGDIRAKPVTGS